MAAGAHEGSSTGSQLLVTTPQPDDSGADTADRYDWQAAMAAADGFRLLLDALDQQGQLPATDHRRIICELHEDWAACDGGDAELVSAKHKELSFGAFTTVNMLLTDGGLAHLFGRWCALHEAPTCRLATTAGLGNGPAQGIEKAAIALRNERLLGQPLSVEGEYASEITAIGRGLLSNAGGLPPRWTGTPDQPVTDLSDDHLAEVARFLSMLTIDHGKPRRDLLRFAAPNMYAKPVLERMGFGTTPPESAWEAVVGLFRTRMRAAGPLPSGGLPEVLAYRPGTSLPGAAEAERRLAARIVTTFDIDAAVRIAVTNPLGYRPLKRIILLNRMGVKMLVGRCNVNAVERADTLRLYYQDHWRTRTSVDHTARAVQEALRRRLLAITDEATEGVAGGLEPWGADLWKEIQRRVNDPTRAWDEPFDDDLLLGGVCDLANLCKVWFSDPFDVEAELGRLRAEQAAG